MHDLLAAHTNASHCSLFTALHATIYHLLPTTTRAGSNCESDDVSDDDVIMTSPQQQQSVSMFILSLLKCRRIAAVSMGIQLLTHKVEPQATPYGYHSYHKTNAGLPGYNTRRPKELYAPSVHYSTSSGITRTQLSSLSSSRTDSL